MAERVWLGRVAQGQQEAHEAFVQWLQSDEARGQLSRYLAGYALVQHGDLLKVVMRADEPMAFVRFLRNQRMWPACWEFVTAGRSDPQEDATEEEHGRVRVEWRRQD